VKFLIGDREIVGTEVIDIREKETLKPDIELGKITVKCRGRDRGKERTCGSGFSRDSMEEFKDPLRFMS
jgi:hypothetical protein